MTPVHLNPTEAPVAFFFATTEDLLPVLLEVEKKHRIKYARFGHHDSAYVECHASASALPTLFLPAPHESALACSAYLVTWLDAPVRPRRISRNDGTTVWSVDQLENEASTVLRHGGRLDADVLLSGEVRTVHKDPAAQKLQRAFDTAIRKHFTKIQAFRVGKQAESLLDAGIRLTDAKQSPRRYDLARPRAAHW